MITDTIHMKYMRALRRSNETHPHIDAVSLALSLALEELASATERSDAELAELRSQAEALHAERIRRTLEAARWN